MLHVVGFGRKIARSGAGIALLLNAAAGAAEPAEPLTVTKLGDPEARLQISTASDSIGTPDGDTDEFGPRGQRSGSRAAAIGRSAVSVDGQADRVHCRSLGMGSPLPLPALLKALNRPAC